MSPFISDEELRSRLDPPYTDCVVCGEDASDVEFRRQGVFVMAEGGASAFANGTFRMCADCASGMTHRNRREAFVEYEQSILSAELGDDEYHWKVDTELWVKRCAAYLSSNESHGAGLRENVAKAIACSLAGYSDVEEYVGVTEGTIKKYRKEAEKRLPGICSATAVDVDGDPEFDLSEIPDPTQKECPVCLHDRLLPPSAAEEIYMTSSWGATAMLDEADLVCSWCHSVKISGEWRRMQALGDRARSISEAGNKSYQEAKESLSGGITPGKNSSTNSGSGGQKAAADADDLEW